MTFTLFAPSKGIQNAANFNMSSKLHLIDTAAFLVIYGSQSSKYGALLKVLLKAVFFYVLHNA